MYIAFLGADFLLQEYPVKMNDNFENRTVVLTSSNLYSLEAGPWLRVNRDWLLVGLFLILSFLNFIYWATGISRRTLQILSDIDK